MTSTKVPTDSIVRNFEVSSGKAKFDIDEKTKALRPKAANGKAVAVPLWSG